MKKHAPAALSLALFIAAPAAGQTTPVRTAAATAPGGNLVRNGSFEGTTRYWFETADKPLVAEGAAFGRYAVAVPKGYLQSAPFSLERGRAVTVAFSVRTAGGRGGGGEMGVAVIPSHREVAQKAGLAWNFGKMKAAFGPQWKRVTFTFTPDVPAQKPWWPGSVYMLQIGGAKAPFELDGVSVTYAAGAAAAYLPRRAVEVAADTSDLPGFKSPTGNLLAPGATVNVLAAAHNPGATPRAVTLRWEILGYDGAKPFGKPAEKRVTLPPGGTAVETLPVKLAGKGLLLARVTAADAATGAVLDRSDLPLTALPYPKAATAPDPRERYGGLPRGRHAAEMARKVGFRWTRWYPQMNWSTIQKDGPDSWAWPDDAIDHLIANGYSMNVVLWSKPKWAFDGGRDRHLPKDMQWAADDPRWKDLSVETAWDRFVKTTVARYRGKPFVWEFENEPELTRYEDERVYQRLAERTARVVKAADPKATFMLNATWPGPTPLYARLFERCAAGDGTLKDVDVFSWHNYTEGAAGTGGTVRALRRALDGAGGKHVRVWFNEGWTFANSATDYDALAIGSLTGAEAAETLVRSVADMAAAGQEKFILFGIAYGDHGHSWWDYYAPGTELWDYAGLPLPSLAAWNVLIHHTGLSERVSTVRAGESTLHLFDDRRNRRGVLVAWNDGEKDAALDLPLTGVVAEDIMGNATPLAPQGGRTRVVLRAGKRPVYLYTSGNTPAETLAARLKSLDDASRPVADGAAGVYRLPQEWGDAAGNPYEVNGRPVWRFDRVWPDDPTRAANYRPLPWVGGQWKAKEYEHAGQPAAAVDAGVARLSARGPWTNNPGEKLPALVFVAPQAGRYTVASGTVTADLWDGAGGPPTRLLVLQKDAQAVSTLKSLDLPQRQPVDLAGITVTLQAGQELVFVPRIGRHNAAGNYALKGLVLRREAD